MEVGTCEYCGSTMTLPKVTDDQRAAAFNRGNHFRRIGEFDKALAVYERIVSEDDTDAEAHWCCALCRFGIEYVEDPGTYEYLPTCHRVSFDSFLEDVDYLAAVKYSDGITRRQYQKDAANIAEVQKGILATSQNEAPFDIFICYKETGEDGNRTRDSLLAQDIYYQLTEQGRRVFFARITLEDKVGSQYEPYIFAALNSAKVMLVVGTDYEYFNAVWVKNEWSRFLKLMASGKKKSLIPCFKGIDAYDMPKEFTKLQAQDLGKVGAMEDLLRGIDKLIAPGQPIQATAQVQTEDINRSFIYNSALDKMKENTIPALMTAIEKLESIAGWSDTDQKLEQAKAQLKKLKRKKTTKRLIIWGVILAAIGTIAGSVLVSISTQKREQQAKYYQNGQSALAEYDYRTAADRFASAGSYQDAQQLEAQSRQWLTEAEAAFSAFTADLSTYSYVNREFGVLDLSNVESTGRSMKIHWNGSIGNYTGNDAVEETVAPTEPMAEGGYSGWSGGLTVYYDAYQISEMEKLSCAIVYDGEESALILLTPDRSEYRMTIADDAITLSGSGEMNGAVFQDTWSYTSEDCLTIAQDLSDQGLNYTANLFLELAANLGCGDDTMMAQVQRAMTQQEKAVKSLLTGTYNDSGVDEYIDFFNMFMNGDVEAFLEMARLIENGSIGGQVLEDILYETSVSPYAPYITASLLTVAADSYPFGAQVLDYGLSQDPDVVETWIARYMSGEIG